MIPAAISRTAATTAIGPQLRPPLTLTGLIGLRPLPAGAFFGGVLPEGRDAGRADLPGGGLPWPDFLSILTVDGTRSGPGVLMLIAPRNQQVELEPSAKVYPDSMAQ